MALVTAAFRWSVSGRDLQDKMENALQETLKWLYKNQLAEKDEFGVVNPIMIKACTRQLEVVLAAIEIGTGVPCFVWKFSQAKYTQIALLLEVEHPGPPKVGWRASMGKRKGLLFTVPFNSHKRVHEGAGAGEAATRAVQQDQVRARGPCAASKVVPAQLDSALHDEQHVICSVPIGAKYKSILMC
eukprot:5386029-Amphidinium_carterae.1